LDAIAKKVVCHSNRPPRFPKANLNIYRLPDSNREILYARQYCLI
jgi:hypothetical protein